ncbi:hypothetical protein SPAN111604_06995 [Sphingomonas antarctica]
MSGVEQPSCEGSSVAVDGCGAQAVFMGFGLIASTGTSSV